MKQKIDRTERIGDMIQQSLATRLLQDMGDARFQRVTVTGVTVARDLSHAKIYVSVLFDEDEKIKAIVKALNHASASLRFRLAHDIKLRVIPELKFVYDDSTAKGFKLSNLINASKIKDEDEE